MNRIAPIHDQETTINIHRPIISAEHPSETEQKVCKICLQEENNNEAILYTASGEVINELELIVPCDCSGSMGYVHQRCIKTWIQKQLSNPGTRRSCCEICKAPIFFKSQKAKYCDCKFKNILQISCCNIISSIIELFLLVVAISVLMYSQQIDENSFLKYLLIILVAVLSIIFVLTILVMIGQAFVRVSKGITRIYSIQQCWQMGLRQIKMKSARQISIPKNTMQEKHQKVKSNRHIRLRGAVAYDNN